MKNCWTKYAICAVLAGGFTLSGVGQDAGRPRTQTVTQAEATTNKDGGNRLSPQTLWRKYQLLPDSVDCKPIRELKVEIEIREALRSKSGLGFQLNAHTLKNEGDAAVILAAIHDGNQRQEGRDDCHS